MFLSAKLKVGAASDASKPFTSLQLPQDIFLPALIPLAAIILDYPVAYIPASAHQMSFLSSVPLVVYRCYVRIREPAGEKCDDVGEQHLLLQFSCPEQLTDASSSLGLDRVVSQLETTFQPRVTQFLPGSTFHVEQEHITLDRVAL